MIHLSSYHSNGLPTVVWSNKVNLIGEKVYKPKIHFCEHCNKPILIYGRLIPCKHVFCFTCATLCLNQQQNSGSLINIDDSTSHTTPTQQDVQDSPRLNGNSNNSINNNSNSNSNQQQQHQQHQQQQQQQNQSSTITTASKGCHRCGGRALRVERNTLNSIFVCQVDTCKRTYLSARDLQAHFTHRHSRNKGNSNAGTSSASLVAISSSPYISSSSLQHLNGHNQSSNNNHHRQSSSSNSTSNNNHTNSPKNHHHQRRERDTHNHHPPGGGGGGGGGRDRERERNREREREKYNRDRDSYQRERERERDSKEYHRQSLQRAAQWAEASAQMLENNTPKN